MAKYEKQFLSKLLDKYEKSKSFTGSNQVTQSFSLEIAKEIPDYKDDARYDIFLSVNESVDRLFRITLDQSQFSLLPFGYRSI